MDVAWELPPPWDWLLIVGVLVVVIVPVFWLSFTGYQRRYFFGKALKLAIVRTVGWLVLYGGSFALVFWLISQVWTAGWLRYVVGSFVWWLLTESVLALGWRFFDRLLEVV